MCFNEILRIHVSFSHLDFSKSGMDSSILSEDSYQRDVDQISISSAASSTSGPSSRERRLVVSSDYTGSYVPMGPGSMPSPGSTGSKVSVSVTSFLSRILPGFSRMLDNLVFCVL